MYRILYMSEPGNAKTLISQTLYANSIGEAIKLFEEDYGFSEKYSYSISRVD
jgi:hypothetical protein